MATAGAGGDLQPLMAAALALRDRGHELLLVGDAGSARTASSQGLQTSELPSSLDLGPRLVGAIKDAMTATGGDPAAAGPLVVESLSGWAAETAGALRDGLSRWGPDAVVTSLFGVEVLDSASLDMPWAVVNSTFYVGPRPPRSMSEDFGPRAIPIIARYESLLDRAALVLHATDQVFDLGFDRLPATHHYVGPLGIWEPPADPPSYLDEPGDPWILMTISSQLQDDLALALTAVEAVEGLAYRAVVTIGPGQNAAELGPVPPNVHVEATISHSAVLQRGRLLVSHAGHGSVMKALWWGRPMVLVPWGRDQPGVAARAEALGVAAVIDRQALSPEALAGSITSAIDAERISEEAKAHSERLRRTDPPATAAALIEQHLLT